MPSPRRTWRRTAGSGRRHPDVMSRVRNSFGVESLFPVFPVGLFLKLVSASDLTPWNEWSGYNKLNRGPVLARRV